MAQITATAMRGVRRSSPTERPRGASRAGTGGRGMASRKNSPMPTRLIAIAAM